MAITKPSQEPVLKIRKNSDQSREKEIYRSEKADENAQCPGTPAFRGDQAQEGPITESNAVLQKAQAGHPNDGDNEDEFEPP